jgi:hypothetical protein
MNGCISFDGRRAVGDTVTVFSCGGRGAGEGETQAAQLFPFPGTGAGGKSLVFAPIGERGNICLIAKNGKIDSAGCTNDASQVFTIV